MLAVEHVVVRAPVRAREEGEPGVEDGMSEVMRELQELKQKVPDARRRMGEREWNRRVNASTPRPFASEVPEAASRAFHKMREIQLTCALPIPEVSVHLCEAPGGFVQAVGVEAPPAWRWTATSLPASDRAPAPAMHLLRAEAGRFVEGDVRDPAHVATLAEDAADLVTADGAVEMDHDRLEEEHLPLLVAQTEAAFRCLKPGGTFVVKFFEGSRLDTQRWVGWVSSQFAATRIVKPTSSRPTNSERYVVGMCYEPQADRPAFEECVVSEAWRQSVCKTLDRLAAEQSRSLRSLVEHVGRDRVHGRHAKLT